MTNIAEVSWWEQINNTFMNTKLQIPIKEDEHQRHKDK